MRTTGSPRKINRVQYFQFPVLYTHLTHMLWQWQTRATTQQWIPFSWYTCDLVFPHTRPGPGSGYRGNLQNEVFKHTKASHSKAPLRCFQFPSALYFRKGTMYWMRILWMENFIRENFTLGGVSNTSALYWLKGRDNKNNNNNKKRNNSRAK